MSGTSLAAFKQLSTSLSWLQVLEQSVSALGLEEARSLAGRGLAELERVVPELKAPDAPGPRNLNAIEFEGSQERFVLLTAVSSFFLRAAEDHRLALVIEDLQWADEASLAVLGFVARRIESSRLAIFATSRVASNEEPSPSLRAVRAAGGGVKNLPLPGLSLEEARTLFGERIKSRGLADTDGGALLMNERTTRPSGTFVTDAQLQALVARAEGNPLYLLELASAPGAESGDLPLSLTDAVRRKLEGLDHDDRALLERAAVIGPRFRLSMLLKTVTKEPADAISRLDALCESG